MANQAADTQKNYFAKIPRAVVVAKIVAKKRLEERVWWAIVLLSWCGPQTSDTCVEKDSGGYIIRDARGQATPAAQADVRRLLGLGEESRGHISTAFERLRDDGFISIDGDGNFAPIDNPAIRTPEEAASIRNTKFKLPGLTIELPVDPDRVQQALGELKPIRTEYNSGLRQLRHETREKARPVIERLGLKPVQKFTPVPAASSCADSDTSTRTADVTNTETSADIGNTAIGAAAGNGNFRLPVSGTFEPAIKEEILERREIKPEEEEASQPASISQKEQAGRQASLTPVSIQNFQNQVLSQLKGHGLPTPESNSWWESLYRDILNRDGHPEAFRERLQTLLDSGRKIRYWGFLLKIVDDIAGGRAEWERQQSLPHPAANLSRSELRTQRVVEALKRERAEDQAVEERRIQAILEDPKALHFARVKQERGHPVSIAERKALERSGG